SALRSPASSATGGFDGESEARTTRAERVPRDARSAAHAGAGRASLAPGFGPLSADHRLPRRRRVPSMDAGWSDRQDRAIASGPSSRWLLNLSDARDRRRGLDDGPGPSTMSELMAGPTLL